MGSVDGVGEMTFRTGVRYRTAPFVALLAGLLAIAACVSSTSRDSDSEAIPEPTPLSTIAPAPTSVAAPTAAPPAATAIPPVQAPSPTPITIGVEPTQLGLFLELQGLTDNNVVRGDFIVASGRTSPDAVLSINGVIIPVGDDGSFEVTLALRDGPNLLEIISSDLAGNEESRVLWVVALPEGA